MSPGRLLTIEDEPTVRRTLVAYLEDSGYAMLEAENGRAGLEAIEREQPDLVLCDLRMPEMDGIQVLRAVAERHPELPFIIVSGTGEIGDAIQAIKLGAWDYVTKPIMDMGVLEHAIQKALERARLVRENREYRDHLEETNRRLRESLRQLEADESAARRIQFQLLPPPAATHHGLNFSHYLRTSAFLSGDFLDYFTYDGERAGFYFADVSGHGVSSAFITVLLKSLMRHLRDQYINGDNDMALRPAEVLAHVNRNILGQGLGKYLTMFYGIIDLPENTMTYSNGGQFPWPVLFDGQRARFLEDRNLPVGLFEEARYPARTIALPERYTLAIFSDGALDLLEDQDLDAKQLFLREQVAAPGVTLPGLVERLGLKGAQSPPDDITVLLLQKGG